MESKDWINEPMSTREMDIVIDKVDYMVRMEKLVLNDSLTTEPPTSGHRSRNLFPEENFRGKAFNNKPGLPQTLFLLSLSVFERVSRY